MTPQPDPKISNKDAKDGKKSRKKSGSHSKQNMNSSGSRWLSKELVN